MAGSVAVLVGRARALTPALVATARSLELGRDLGPIVSAEALERLHTAIAAARTAGAEILLDGRTMNGPTEGGYWLGPTIVRRTIADQDVGRQEVFGPVRVTP